MDLFLDTLRFRVRFEPERTFSGDWQARLPLKEAGFLILSSGGGWASAGSEPPGPLTQGDLLIVTRPATLRLASQPEHAPEPRDWSDAGLLAEPFGDARAIVASIEFPDGPPGPLLRLLPDQLVLKAADSGRSGTLSRLVRLVIDEVRDAGARDGAVRERIGSALVLEALRQVLERQGDARPGWWRGAADHDIGPVVEQLLRRPEQDWSIAAMAELGAMSRSTFARRFQEALGCAPMDFLLEVRMRRASARLTSGESDLKSVARDVGYRSTAAFSAAFKRWSGRTPSDVRSTEGRPADDPRREAFR
ncbi:MAG: helix-turn-helix transcriptional regulator [Planctomyces sp.]|nr:helix-turn-helix transcriptional regulator [Planctomyces sp.]